MLTNNYRHLKILVLPSKCKKHSPLATKRRNQRIDYTGCTDICNIGITIWELLARKKPFYHTDYTADEIFEAVLRGIYKNIIIYHITIIINLPRRTPVNKQYTNINQRRLKEIHSKLLGPKSI